MEIPANIVPKVVEGEIWLIEQWIFFHASDNSQRSISLHLANKQGTEAQVKVLILKITCGSALLCELYVVGSNETVQVCAVKCMCEYEQCWNMKMHFTAVKCV